jgi:hypothetical protein
VRAISKVAVYLDLEHTNWLTTMNPAYSSVNSTSITYVASMTMVYHGTET